MINEKIIEDKIENIYGTSSDKGYSQEYINNNVGIVDSGSNDNGNWIKYSDGTMICYSRKTLSTIINVTYGNLYRSYAITLDNYPQSFTDDPMVQITTQNGAMFIHGIVGTTSPGTIMLIAAEKLSAANYIINVLAIGKWK